MAARTDGSKAGQVGRTGSGCSVIMALRRRRSSPERAAQAVTRGRRSRRCRPARAHEGTRALGSMSARAAWWPSPLLPPAAPSRSPPGSCAANFDTTPAAVARTRVTGGRGRVSEARDDVTQMPQDAQDNRRAQENKTRDTQTQQDHSSDRVNSRRKLASYGRRGPIG